MNDRSDGRVALVGASGPLGREVRSCLEQAGFPGAALVLLDLDEEVGLLTDYADEARVILEAAADNVADHPVACFCGLPELVERLGARVRDAGGIAIDASGASWGDMEARLVDIDTVQEAVATGPGMISVPHPATLLLSSLAAALGNLMADASVTLLLPASERGTEGLEELARQATALLNFAETPTAELGRRVAFDAFPVPGDDPTMRLVPTQLKRLGRPCPRLGLLRVGVFHELAASVHLPALPPDRAAAALCDAGVLVGAADAEGRELDSPANIAGQATAGAAEPRDDGRGGSWLWIVQDNHRAVADIVAAAALAATGRESHRVAEKA